MSNPRAIAVEYVIEGKRSAAAVARGETRLLGVAIHDGGQSRFHANIQETFSRYEGATRVFDDAGFGFCVEGHYGLPRTEQFHDTRVMLRLLEENLDIPQAMEDLAGCSEEPASSRTQWPDKNRKDRVDSALRRVNALNVLIQRLPQDLNDEALWNVYNLIEKPILAETAHMIRRGIRIDTDRFHQLLTDWTTRLDSAQSAFCAAVGRPVNLNSYPELNQLLFQELRLPVVALTDAGNPSITCSTLDRLMGNHRSIKNLRDYLSANPVVSQLSALSKHVFRGDRITAELDPLGAVTGRYTCQNPNLQGLSSAVRPVFMADEGHLLIEADLSQTELRVLAQCSQNPGLIEAFTDEGVDIHQRTTAQILQIPEAQVTPDQRQNIGKPVNFGIIYGQTEFGLAEQLGLSVIEARHLIEAYFRSFPSVRTWIESIHQWVSENGYVTTLYGRRRRLPEVSSSDSSLSAHARRQAVNSVIQGTAADVLKLAIPRVAQAIAPEGQLLLTVHDSVLLQAPAHRVHQIAEAVRQVMETPPPGFEVPLKVTIGIGRTWAECKSTASKSMGEVEHGQPHPVPDGSSFLEGGVSHPDIVLASCR